MIKDDVYIIGNSYSCLLLATLIKNRKVYLISNFSFLGGIFNGYNSNLGHFDFGMNFVELFEDRHGDIKLFDPHKRNNFLGFTSDINNFFNSNFKLKKVSVGLSYVNGNIEKDYIIFNKLNFLNEIPENHKKIIRKQLNVSSEFHPSKKNLNFDLFYKNSYDFVCRNLYGDFFYERYLEPFLLKVMNCKGTQVPAIFHRLAWMPLYYPESIKEALNGNFFKSVNNFYYPEERDFNILVDNLKELINKSENVEIIDKEFQFMDSNFLKINENSVKSNNIFVGKNHKLHLSPAESKTSLILVFIKIEANYLSENFSVINIIDENTPIYRITNQSSNNNNASSYKLCVEINKDYKESKFDKSEVIDDINDFLIKSKLITKKILNDSVEIKYLNNAFIKPTYDNYLNFNSNKLNNDFFKLLSPINSFFSNSLNEQVAEAIKYAKLLNNE